MLRRSLLSSLVLVAALMSGGRASGQVGNNPLITVDEFGAGSLVFPTGGGTFATTGVLAPDPGPGGLALALTYNLLGPPGLVAGDVLIFEPGTNILSDLIRFNPAGTGGLASYPASLVFYSDNSDGIDAPADTGFPGALYANQARLTEVAGPGGTFGAFYTPTANQPGFIPGFGVTYHFISDNDAVATPEPATIASASIAGVAAIAYALRRRKAKLSR